MTIVHYTARVQENGSLTLSKEAQEALNLQPGDEIQIQAEGEAIEQEREELRQALDVGLEQLERGEYSVYTADTLQDLVTDVRAEGHKRLAPTREEVGEQVQRAAKEHRFRLVTLPPSVDQKEDDGPTLAERLRDVLDA